MPTPLEAALPSNLDAEQQILGALLMSEEVFWRVSPFLAARHFFEPLHARIYQIASEMILARKPCSPVTIVSYLPADMPILEGFNLKSYVAHLAAESVGPQSAENVARVIFDLAAKRAAISIGEDLAFQARRTDKARATTQVLAEAAADLFDLTSEVDDACVKRVGGSFSAVVSDAEKRLAAGADAARGVPSGLAGLDWKIGGVAPGDLCLLAGRPGMGKSCVSVAWSRRASFRRYGVLFLSYEMGINPIMARFLTDHCEAAGVRIPYSAVDRRMIKPENVAPLQRAATTLAGLPLIVLERGHRLADIVGHCRAARRELKAKGATLDLVVIDQVSYVEGSGNYRGDRTREIGEISRGLKRIARDEEVGMLALHQLNRAVESRKDKRPVLSDLRESGDLEQDADTVLFVYRPGYYEADNIDEKIDGQSKMEVVVAKNRQGPLGIVDLWCDMSTNSVRDASQY